MGIQHKFQQFSFGSEFATNNSILSTVPYDPEVIFIGTFNHGWNWNDADFFYGRGMYMWPIMSNLFIHNSNKFTQARNNNSNPSIDVIYEICTKGRMVFADIVKGTNPSVPVVEAIDRKCIILNENYCWGSYKDSQLDFMGDQGWLDDNVQAITEYINKVESIRHVYFTFKSGPKWLEGRIDDIRQRVKRQNVTIESIFTPTGLGFGKNLGEGYDTRIKSLTHCWVWNQLEHSVPIKRDGYGHLDHDWLRRNGVDPNKF